MLQLTACQKASALCWLLIVLSTGALLGMHSVAMAQPAPALSPSPGGYVGGIAQPMVTVDDEGYQARQALRKAAIEAIMRAAADPKGEFSKWMLENNRQYKTPEEQEMRFQAWSARTMRVIKSTPSLNSPDPMDPATGHYPAIGEKWDSLEPKMYATGYREENVTATNNETNKDTGTAQMTSVSNSTEAVHRRSLRYDTCGFFPSEWDARYRNYEVSYKWLADTPRAQSSTCGSCAAFAAAAAIELTWAIFSDGIKVALSEQALLDCARRYRNNEDGCEGASPYGYLLFAQRWGLPARETYRPYNARGTDLCDNVKFQSQHVTGYLTPFQMHDDESSFATMGSNCFRPFVAYVNADEDGPVQTYGGGVITARSCSDDTNHAVLVIGFGQEDGIPYWRVRNSWGARWGGNRDGHFKIRRGGNVCGIGQKATWAQLTAANTLYNYVMYAGMDSPGYDREYHDGAFTAEACSNLCEDRKWCNAWVFSFTQARCWLKWAAPTRNHVRNSGGILGVRKTGAGLDAPGATQWGSWSPVMGCANTGTSATFANCMDTRVQPQCGSSACDGTALNAVKLRCTNGDTLVPHPGFWGTWNGTLQCCPSGHHFTGIQMKAQPECGSACADDTAVNSIRMKCSDGTILEARNGGGLGYWRAWKECPAGTRVCGISMKVQGYDDEFASGDDTAANGVYLQCCRV